MPPLYIVLEYGAEVTTIFYPTPGSDGVAADGYASRRVYDGTWADIHNGAGTAAYPTSVALYIGFTRTSATLKWLNIMRTLLHFDTRLLPVGSKINSALVYFRGNGKADGLGSVPSLALVESTDPSPGDITSADYQNLNAVSLANIIAYADFSTTGFNIFTITPENYDKIIGGGITKLGLREYKYDCLYIEPPLTGYPSSYFQGYSRDNSLETSPYLEVTYQPRI
jgi:hypothetical protein